MQKFYMLTDELPKTEENIFFCQRITSGINEDHPSSARIENRFDNIVVMITEDYRTMCEMYVRDYCRIKG